MAIALMPRIITLVALVLGAQGSNATNSTKPANTTKSTGSNTTKPAASNTTKPTGSNTTKPAETKPVASNTTKPTGSNTTKPAETKPTVSNATKPAASNKTKPTGSNTTKPTGSNTTKPAETKSVASNTTEPTGSNTTKPAETKPTVSNATKPAGSNTTKPSESNTTKPAVTASPTVVKGNIKFGVLMNATEAASFVKDAKVVLGVETGIAKKLNLTNVSWVKATLSVVTARRLGAAANATANINVDFVITVPATATSAPSASTLEASLQKTDQASKALWKDTLTTEIKKAAPAHANLEVTVSSIAHTPVTTPAPGSKTQLSPSIRASLPHLAGLVVMVAAALF